MGISIKSILELPIMEHAKLLAGSFGLQRTVEGISLLESTDSTKYLTKNTLVLNHYQLIRDNPEWSTNLIYALHKKGCSGLAVKADRHASQLPEPLLSSAEKLGFPVIALPPQCISAELITSITYEVFRSQYHDPAFSYDQDFLMSLLLDGGNDKVLRNQGVALGWSLKKCLGVAILFPLFPAAQSRIQELSRHYGFTWMLATQRHYILVSDLQKSKEQKKILEQSSFEFAGALGKQLPEYAFHIGVGRTYQKLLYASQSFKEAQIALTVNIA